LLTGRNFDADNNDNYSKIYDLLNLGEGIFMPEVTAVIPAYNEALSIGSIVLQASMFVDRVIVIDDGSTDNTARIVELTGAELIKHPKNMGKGVALKDGFKAARNSDIIVTLDADGQHKTSEIPKLLKPIIDGKADIVNGSRYINGNRNDTPIYRRLGQIVLDKATNFNVNNNVTDSQSGFRAFSNRTLSAFRFDQNGYGIESEMLIEASNANFKIQEVEIDVRYDVDGSKKNPITHGLGVLFDIIREMKFHKPIYYYTFPGFFLIVLGLILSSIFITDYLIGRSHSLTPTTFAVLLTIIGTFISFTGIILQSVSGMIDRTLGK
jgi:glycosyltransferase involved in cell wall biosynthesis